MRQSVADPSAFEEIFRRHHSRIYTYLARRVGTDPAADLASEVFLIAFRKRRSFRVGATDAAPWLFGIASNLAKQQARRVSHRTNAHVRSAAEPSPRPYPGDAEDIDRLLAQQQQHRLNVALGRLSSRDREVFLLLALASLSYAEIAEAVGVPIGTVRSRLNRARQQLEDALQRTGAVESGKSE